MKSSPQALDLQFHHFARVIFERIGNSEECKLNLIVNCRGTLSYENRSKKSRFREPRGSFYLSLLPSLSSSLDSSLRAEERRPAGVSKVFTHSRCRDLPINHCNSACPAPSRAIRVRICISDYTGREGGNGLLLYRRVYARARARRSYA